MSIKKIEKELIVARFCQLDKELDGRIVPAGKSYARKRFKEGNIYKDVDWMQDCVEVKATASQCLDRLRHFSEVQKRKRRNMMGLQEGVFSSARTVNGRPMSPG